ncbi:hypothetical protein ABZU45_35540 [Streptomyces avermitilis]|uniref:hypothetical protein n=1 Tax=Streptomyces avermitilis TaxID=33903 RepID=UPI0033B1573A
MSGNIAAEYPLTAALPFILGIGLQGIGIASAVVIERRIRAIMRKLYEKDKISEEGLPSYWSPEGISRFAVWAADVTQAISVTLVPGFALILDQTGHIEGSSFYPYLWTMIGGIALFFFATFCVKNPSRYHNRSMGPFAPVPIVGFILNLIFLFVVLS